MDELLYFFFGVAEKLSRLYIEKKIDVGDFQLEFRAMLRTLFTAMLVDGQGGVSPGEIDPKKFLQLGTVLQKQYRFLERFMRQVAAGKLSDRQIIARAALYVQASTQMYWRGVAEVRLPAYPRDGSCVVTPQSRVFTSRGLIPIKDVIVGDVVFTHKNRWRKVIGTRVTLSEHKELCSVKMGRYSPVSFTSDHNLYTTHGWYDIRSIDKNMLSVYTIGTIYRSIIYAKKYFVSLLRRVEGLSRQIMCELYESNNCNKSMEKSRDTREDADLYQIGTQRKTYNMGQNQSGHSLAIKTRWSILDMVLGRRQEIYGISLPVGLDNGKWADTEWVYNTSQRWELLKRFAGKFGMFVERYSHASAREINFRKDSGVSHLSSLWESVQGKDKGKSQQVLLSRMLSQGSTKEQSLGLRKLWERICGYVGSWKTPEILFKGMLPDGTFLYDLEVEEDNSFIIEGIVAHNSECLTNCKCEWEIGYRMDSSGKRTHLLATWKLHPAEHCPTCLERAATWNPLEFPLE